MGEAVELKISSMKNARPSISIAKQTRLDGQTSKLISNKLSVLVSLACHLLVVLAGLVFARDTEIKTWPAIELIPIGNGGTSLAKLSPPSAVPTPSRNQNQSQNKSRSIQPVPPAPSDLATLAEQKQMASDASKQSDSKISSNAVSTTGDGSSNGMVGSPNGALLASRERYFAHVEATLQNAKEFPALASRLGHSGEVVVKFTVQRDGLILNPIIQRPSTYSSLNQAAIALLKKIRHFEPFPNEIRENTLEMIIPISYGL